MRMRHSYGISAATVVGLTLALAATAMQTSCFLVFNLDDCSQYPRPECFDGGSGSDGGEGGPPPDCSGDPTTDPAIVTDTCGVFVSTSAAPGGDGKQATPFQTFAEAAAAKPARVFACAGAYTETMQVLFSGGVEVYGGFSDCGATSWTWSASVQAQIATVAGVPGVVLDGGANKLENVSVTAPSVPMTMSGGSSIALLVNGGSLEMMNGALTAGDAQDGAAGTTVADDPMLDGAVGTSGAGTCDTGATSPGALGATNTCATGGSSTAGNGGNGGDPAGRSCQQWYQRQRNTRRDACRDGRRQRRCWRGATERAAMRERGHRSSRSPGQLGRRCSGAREDCSRRLPGRCRRERSERPTGSGWGRRRRSQGRHVGHVQLRDGR